VAPDTSLRTQGGLNRLFRRVVGSISIGPGALPILQSRRSEPRCPSVSQGVPFQGQGGYSLGSESEEVVDPAREGPGELGDSLDHREG